MKYFLLSIFTILFSSIAYSQNIIKGKLTDSHNSPVAFAFITLLQNDSSRKAVAAKIADSSGNYVLEVKEKGNYILHATAVGYEETRDTIVVNNSSEEINLTMKKSENNLHEVSVSSQKPFVERKIDRLVMNVENNPLTAGKSSMETMELAPGIVIFNNQIMLNGIPISKIMVNGKMLQLSGQSLTNYLNSLRSEDIKSIEIMAHPPAEYDAESSGGIINIILKHQTQAGLNGSVYGNFVQGKEYPGTSEGAQLNFKKGKIGVFANYDYYYQKYYQNLSQTRSFTDGGIYTAADNAIKHESDHDIRTGLTYDITSKQYLAIDYTGSFGNDVENWTALSNVNYPSNPINNSTSSGLFPNVGKGKYNNFGLNYHLQTDTLGSTFTLLSDYTHNSSEVNNSVTSTTVANGISTDTAYKNYTPSTAKIFTADAKYLKVFNTKNSLSFGAKISSTSIDNEASFQYQSPYGSEWMNNIPQNFIYDYNEHIVAGYMNYQGKILNTDVQAGLRGENTNYTGKLYDTSYAENGKKYFGLFPSLFLKRTLNKAGDESLTFIYTRRLSRPSFDNLNPHVVYIDNYTTGRGNPYLQPEYDNSYELVYTLKNKYTFVTNYFYATDVITNGIHPVAGSPDQMTQQPTNSGTSSKWMFNAYIPIKITKWWTTGNYAEYDYQHLNAPGAYNFSKNLITLSTNMQFTLAKDFTASLHTFYVNKIIEGNAVIDHLTRTSIGLQKKFFKQRLILKASADDVFNTGKTVSGTFYYTDFNLNFQNRQQWQKFTLGFVYNFDLGKAFQSHKVENSNDDEKSRLK
ncbi:MAG: outer membrane beta-barrel family protein [Arachidicoccus sp.]|nr:outer membrane beta-barrel family protein [Arachidicoccus sp.]